MRRWIRDQVLRTNTILALPLPSIVFKQRFLFFLKFLWGIFIYCGESVVKITQPFPGPLRIILYFNKMLYGIGFFFKYSCIITYMRYGVVKYMHKKCKTCRFPIGYKCPYTISLQILQYCTGPLFANNSQKASSW